MPSVAEPREAPPDRVLVLAPTGRDAEVVCQVLRRAGVDAEVRGDMRDACEAVGPGVGAVVLAEEALAGGGLAALKAALGTQEPWSDLPLVLLATAGAGDGPDARLRALTLFEPHGNVTVLERPVRIATLVTAVRAALRARARQHDARALLARLETAASALRASEERLRLLIDLAADGILVADADGRLTEANSSACRMLAYPGEALLGVRMADLVVADDRARLDASRARLLAGGTEVAEWTLVRRDGTLLATEMSAKILPDGRWQAIVRDVTERKRAESATRLLAEAGSRLSASLDDETTVRAAAQVAIPFLADWCVVYLAGGGARPRLAVVTGDGDEPPAIEAEAPQLRDAIDRVLATGAAELVHGEPAAIVAPLVARGRTLGVIAFVSRVGRPTRGTADLDLAGELARRAAIAVDNARLYAEAREAVAARDEFLARASHELRTPLTSALGTVRLLARALGGGLDERPDELVGIATRSLSAMLALVNDLLDASKLSLGRESLVMQPLDLGAVVRASVEIVAVQARERQVSLDLAVGAGVAVPGDRLKLEQVFVNLLSNAVNFTPPGGQVRVEADAAQAEVTVRVRDTGRGIAREHLERVFEPFFRVVDRESAGNGDRRLRPRGTGLGLAICRQILMLHGGTVRAESAGRDCGSTFVVTLPRAAARPGEAAA